MNDFVRFIGSIVIASILMSIPGLLVASFAFEWHGFLKALLCVAAIVEDWIFIILFITDERSEK